VVTIPLSAARPADWRQGTNLSVDEATGAAYVSWCTGGGTAPRCGLDRLDPGRGARTTVASVGGLLLGLDPVHGLALLQDMAGTVRAAWIGPAQGVAAPIPLPTALGPGSGTRTLEVPIAAAAGEARAAVATPDGLLLALDTILPLHDDVTNAPTTDGLVLITLTVPPPREVSRSPPGRGGWGAHARREAVSPLVADRICGSGAISANCLAPNRAHAGWGVCGDYVLARGACGLACG